MKTHLCGLLLSLCLMACGAPGRPSGLPDPEYQQPQVEPWPPASAAVPTAAPPTAEPADEPADERAKVGIEPAPEAPAGLPQNAGGSGATLPAGTP